MTVKLNNKEKLAKSFGWVLENNIWKKDDKEISNEKLNKKSFDELNTFLK